MIWKPTTTSNELVPSLALRLLSPFDRRHTAGAGANRYGNITQLIRPISLTQGTDGSVLSCRIPRSYAVCSDPDYLHESLCGYWATLEYRPNSNNKALQKVLFRGVTSSEPIQYSSSENGVEVTFWDRLGLADDVIELNTGYLNLGVVLSTINDMDVWPVDTDGNRLGGIDPALFERKEWSGNTSINGTPVPQAFADLFAKQKGDIPWITYDAGGKMLLTVIERGEQEIDLTVQRVRVDTGVKKRELDIKELRGLIDYSRMATRITGRGDLTRTATTVDLVPAWDTSLNNAVLANPSLVDTDPRYEDVGKLYEIPVGMYPYNAEANGSGSAFKPQAWGRRNSLGEWMAIDNDGDLVRDGSESVDPLLGRSSTHFSDGRLRRYRFSAPQIWRDYTEEQQIQREGGAEVDPEVGFLEIQMTCMYQGPELTYDTGYVGDYPIRRRRILRNNEYSKLVAENYFRRKESSLIGRVSAAPATYDHSAPLQSECLAAIAVTSRPAISLTAVITHCNFNWLIGARVRNIYDTVGKLVFEDVGWYIEGITTYFNTGQDNAYTMELTFDNALQDMLGGVIL